MQRAQLKGSLVLLFITVIVIVIFILIQHETAFASEMKSMSAGVEKFTGEIKTPSTLPIINTDVSRIDIMSGSNDYMVTIFDQPKIDRICEFINNAAYYVYNPEWLTRGGGWGGTTYWIEIYNIKGKVLFQYSLSARPAVDGETVYGMADPDREAFTNLLTEYFKAGEKIDRAGEPEKYDDVKPAAWYCRAVQFVSRRGLMEGADRAFEPEAVMSRGAFISTLARLEKIDAANDGERYQWAESKGLTDGSNLNDTITREQLVTILYNYAELHGLDTSVKGDTAVYSDRSGVSPWAEESISWAITKGLISGRTASAIVPQGTVSRAEAAEILKNYILKIM